MPRNQNPRAQQNSGNMLIYILGAIFLMGILIVLLKGSFQEGTGVDAERSALLATQVETYATALGNGVNNVLENGRSESEIRFAHPDANVTYGVITSIPNRQVFDPTGGGVEYAAPPIGANDGTQWQFYANTHIKDVGTDTAASQKAELLAVLPNMVESVCSAINTANGQTLDLTLNADPSANGCIFGGTVFTGTYGFGSSVNTIDHTLFTRLPPVEACIRCQGGNLHYYRVLLSR